MNCEIIRDLIPLYIDECCSKESERIVEEHVKDCEDCKKVLEDMKSTSDIIEVSRAPKAFSKLNDWKASILQSVMLFLSFALITIGVALEARTPSGLLNGFWAFNLVIPATGFLLSLANWYFVRIYKSRKLFSYCSLIATLGVTLCANVWAAFHYEMNIFEFGFSEIMQLLYSSLILNRLGIILTIAFCTLSKILSNQYAKMLGKE